jgi:hypothetical protein
LDTGGHLQKKARAGYEQKVFSNHGLSSKNWLKNALSSVRWAITADEILQ